MIAGVVSAGRIGLGTTRKLLLLSLFLLVVSSIPPFAPISSAQRSIPQPRSTTDDARKNQPVSFTGKVVVAGGSGEVADVNVVLQCDNEEVSHAATDRKGGFMLVVNPDDPSREVTNIHKGPIGSQQIIRSQGFSWTRCSLSGDAPGYTSEVLYLDDSPAASPRDVGIITLHPRTSTQSGDATVSVLSLAAPEPAKKLFAKGQKESGKKHWASASNFFRQAVRLYPRYALAWLELGRAQKQLNDPAGAQDSFQQVTSLDPHLVAGYVELANVEGLQKEWNLLALTTDRAIQLSSNTSPLLWFYNSAAKYNIGDLMAAEHSATRGIGLDTNHEIPQLEYIYGLILARQHNYREAIAHIQNYLRMAPHSSEAEQAQRYVSMFQQLMSGGESSASH